MDELDVSSVEQFASIASSGQAVLFGGSWPIFRWPEIACCIVTLTSQVRLQKLQEFCRQGRVIFQRHFSTSLFNATCQRHFSASLFNVTSFQRHFSTSCDGVRQVVNHCCESAPPVGVAIRTLTLASGGEFYPHVRGIFCQAICWQKMPLT